MSDTDLEIQYVKFHGAAMLMNSFAIILQLNALNCSGAALLLFGGKVRNVLYGPVSEINAQL